MASLFKDKEHLSPYRDRRFKGTQEDFERALRESTTLYIGNLSFYSTEEQVYDLFSRCGEVKKIIMGLDKNSKTPCGFCFVMYYTRDDTADAVKYISGTILDERPIRVDFDWGFQDGRQFGRGRSGGQVRDEYRTDYDPGRGGYGKLVQKELEEQQRQLVEYGGPMGGMDSWAMGFGGVMPAPAVPIGGAAAGGSGRAGGDLPRGGGRGRYDGGKRRRMGGQEEEEGTRRDDKFDDGVRGAGEDLHGRQEKNPRFRERGGNDSDDEDGRR